MRQRKPVADHFPTRRDLLRAGAAAGAVAGAGSLLDAPGGLAAQAPVTDVTVLVSLLRVEHVLVVAYERALGTAVFAAPVQQTLASFLGHERAHVHALSFTVAKLGGTGPAAPKTTPAFESALRQLRVRHSPAAGRKERGQLRFLIDLETVIARHYRYAIARLSGAREISLVAEIMANEAQHETVLHEVLTPGNVKRAVPSAFVAGIA